MSNDTTKSTDATPSSVTLPDEAAIRTIKDAVRERVPGLRSGHAGECVAAGCGMNSHDQLLHELRRGPVTVAPDDETFRLRAAGLGHSDVPVGVFLMAAQPFETASASETVPAQAAASVDVDGARVDGEADDPIIIVCERVNRRGEGYAIVVNSWKGAGYAFFDDDGGCVEREKRTLSELVESWGSEEDVPEEALSIAKEHGSVVEFCLDRLADKNAYFAPGTEPSMERIVRDYMENCEVANGVVPAFLQGEQQIRDWFGDIDGTDGCWTDLAEEVALKASEAGYEIDDVLEAMSLR